MVLVTVFVVLSERITREGEGWIEGVSGSRLVCKITYKEISSAMPAKKLQGIG